MPAQAHGEEHGNLADLSPRCSSTGQPQRTPVVMPWMLLCSDNVHTTGQAHTCPVKSHPDCVHACSASSPGGLVVILSLINVRAWRAHSLLLPCFPTRSGSMHRQCAQ